MVEEGSVGVGGVWGCGDGYVLVDECVWTGGCDEHLKEKGRAYK